MTSPAKLSAPVLPKSYQRDALFDLIEQRRKPLGVWIAGLPGAGKTTAVVGYLSRRAVTPLWYRCDEGDKDPSTFFYYLAQLLPVAVRGDLPEFTAEYRADIGTFSRHYFRGFFAKIGEPVTLVLDNYQDAATDLINEIMQYALADMPGGFDVVFISRATPPASFSKICANGLLGVVTPAEMRLTYVEAMAIGGSTSDPIAVQRLRQIFDATEGWAAGMVLLNALNSTTAIHFPHESTEPAAVFDYFAAEIFKKLPPAAQHILAVTSLLPLPTTALAVALSNKADAGAVLENLFAQGYFITANGDRFRTFQFHPLFRSFLLRQVEQMTDRVELKNLKRKAVELMEQDGQIEAALDLCSTDVDASLLAALLQSYGADLLRQGRYEIVDTWLARLSDQALAGEPWLQYWTAAARLPADLRFSQKTFAGAFAVFFVRGDCLGIYASWAAAVNALCIDGDGDYSRLDPWITGFDNVRSIYPKYPNEEVAGDVAYSMYFALYYRSPQDHRASHWRRQALALATSSNDPFKKANVVQRAIVHDLLIGNHARARLHMATFEALEEETKCNPRVTAAIKYTQIYFKYRVGEFDAALDELWSGMEVATASGYGIWVHHLLSHGAAAAISNEDYALADRLLKKMGARINVERGFGAMYRHVLLTWNAICRNQLSEAHEHAEAALRISAETNHILFNGCCAFGSAIVYFLIGQVAQAREALANALKIAREIESVILQHMCLMVEADFAFAEGRHSDAITALREGLAKGREQRYNSFIFWIPATMSRLCLHALQNRIEVDYVHFIIRSRKLQSPQIDAPEWPWRVRIETLGPFKISVDGIGLEFGRKEPKKLIALLKAIIAFGGEEVSQIQLLDTLWIDHDGDEAQMAFDKALQRLRKLLGEKTVIAKAGRVSLDRSIVWVDAFAVQRSLVSSDDATDVAQIDSAKIEQLLSLYRAPFLADDHELGWASPMRNKLHKAILRNLKQTAHKYLLEGDFQRALQIFERCLAWESREEVLYQGALYCQIHLARYVEAETLYQQLSDLFETRLPTNISPRSLQIHAALIARSPSLLPKL